MSGAGLRHEHRIGLLALGAGLPAVVVALALLFASDLAPRAIWTLAALAIVPWLALALAIPGRVARPLQNVASVLSSFREGDFSISIRARDTGGADALALASREINALGATLREQRLGALEASALLAKVVAEIDVAVFTCDASGRLRLVNRIGERLLGRPSTALVSRSADEVGLGELLSGEAPRTLMLTFPEGASEWELRRSAFRLEGRTHTLIVLTPLDRALHEREREAWQRLVRVLGHEINNSLAPIRSIAESSLSLLRAAPRPVDADDDLARGLGVIARRSAALGRFLSAFASLARLPPPRFEPVSVPAWVERAVALETRLSVAVDEGPAVVARGDADQLDQLLINLVRNAVDASLETGGGVRVTWSLAGPCVEVRVLDEGPGVADATSLFVPFFTTKAEGTGIGLALSRQVAEAHGGKLTLENRTDRRGCEARLLLPR
jgi:nitrogen fixation/metabolism regulation signal transduction histidine kinase